MGLLYIASMLEAKHQVSIIDALAEGWRNVHKIEINGEDKWYGGLEFTEVAKRMKENDIKLVGITVPFSISYWSAQKVASVIKDIDKNIITVLGGHHVTVRPAEVLANKDVDFIVVGEGEYTMLELAEALQNNDSSALERIEGIGFKRNGKPVINSARRPIQNLDELPFPARHLLSLENYSSAVEAGQSSRGDYLLTGKKWATVITSRGCPYECVFCAISLTMGRKWRARSAQNVVKEIEELVNKYGIRHLSIEDDNMTLDIVRAKQICDMIIQKKLGITWCMPNGVRADALDEELIKKMQASGCTEVFVAPESGDQEVVNNIIKKRMDLEKVEEAVRLFKKYGIKVNAVFVIGCIGETKKNIQQSISFARKLISLGAKGVCANIATPYYGTELYRQAKEKGYLLDILNDEHLSSAQPLISAPEFKPKELQEYRDQFYLLNPLSGVLKIMTSIVFTNPKLLVKSAFSLKSWRFLIVEMKSRIFVHKNKSQRAFNSRCKELI
jgi:magnesium-protoporphyrin IX monomethyl ester (oxidative) cyclase